MHPAHTLICLSKGGLVITTHRIKVKPNKLREVMDIPLISLATLLLLKIICRLKSYAPCSLDVQKREESESGVLVDRDRADSAGRHRCGGQVAGWQFNLKIWLEFWAVKWLDF